jgi:hypothetical protein
LSANRANDDGNREIVVRRDRSFAQQFLITVTLTVILILSIGRELYIAGEVHAGHVKSPRDIPFLYLLLLGWALVWVLFGAEVLTIGSGELTVKLQIGPIAIGRAKVFSVANIRDMRIEERKLKIRGRSRIKHVITIDYLGQRRDFLVYLSKERGESLLDGPLRRFVRA